MSYQQAFTMRQSILDYLHLNPGALQREITNYLDRPQPEVSNWIQQCLKAGEIRFETIYEDGKRASRYYAMKKETYYHGPGTPEYKAIAAKISQTNKKQKTTRVPGLRVVLQLDKPCIKNQEGIGSGHHKVFIGSARGW